MNFFPAMVYFPWHSWLEGLYLDHCSAYTAYCPTSYFEFSLGFKEIRVVFFFLIPCSEILSSC